MKIGIITQPLHSNYGGLLQNYALQQVLKRFGNEIVTLNQDFAQPSKLRLLLSFVKTFILRLIGKGNNRKYPFIISKEQKAYIRKNTNYFIDKYINKTEVLNTFNDFRNYTLNHNLDALVVGSDQVWRPRYNKNVLRSFLDFTEGLKIKRITYAASFGVDYWEFADDQTTKSKELIQLFDAVSVRENSGVDLCANYLNCKAKHVLDPTMLLDKEDYICLVENEKEPKSSGDLFTYILDESTEKNHIIDFVANSLGLVPFKVMPCKIADRKTVRQIDDCVYPRVTQWLQAFMDAKFVICDSFHGAVFSIIFNKPFLIIGNKERGMTRFNSLLDTFDLQERMTNDMSMMELIINTQIDWEKVNHTRSVLKNKSLEFIKSSL